MKILTRREAALLDELQQLKAEYQQAPSPERRAAIKAKAAEFHATHAEAVEAVRALQES